MIISMNHVVAYKLLADELAAYRQLPADDIRQLAGEHSTRLVRGEDGVDYNISVVVRSRHDKDEYRVIGFVGLADWGSPHDVLDEAIVAPISGD
jgi:hypothetical protein